MAVIHITWSIVDCGSFYVATELICLSVFGLFCHTYTHTHTHTHTKHTKNTQSTYTAQTQSTHKAHTNKAHTKHSHTHGYVPYLVWMWDEVQTWICTVSWSYMHPHTPSYYKKKAKIVGCRVLWACMCTV